MLGHREFTIEDYLSILKRRRWMILVPTIAVPIIALIVTIFLPAKYLSQTLVLIEQQRVPDDIVKPVVTEDLTARLASMREQILSRTSLQPIIERFSLYSGDKPDDRVDKMRKAIDIKPIRSDIVQTRTNGLPGFFISYTGENAATAQQVCGEISSMFLAENLRHREQSSQGTTDFLKSQLDDAKRGLDEQAARLVAFQKRYAGQLPGEEQTNMSMITTLSTQLEASTQALARMLQDKTYMETMVAQQTHDQQIRPTESPESPKAIQEELEKMQQSVTILEARYTPDHPDVIKAKHEVEAQQKKLEDAKLKAATPAPPSGKPQGAVRDSPALAQLKAQLHALDVGIVNKRAEQDHLQQQIRSYQARISSSPMVQAEYNSLTRDHDTAQQFYNDLLTKKSHAEMATDMERRQEGEQFRVMDPPNLPESASFPNLWIFGFGGLAGGLLLGFTLAGAFEYKDHSLRNDRDIFAFTQLPTLATIPLLEEISKPDKPRRFRWLRFGRKNKQQQLASVQG